MIKAMGVRPIIFSVNCYIATILTMFIAFGLDLKSPGWAMTTVYLTIRWCLSLNLPNSIAVRDVAHNLSATTAGVDHVRLALSLAFP
jgi:hypothetical protein